MERSRNKMIFGEAVKALEDALFTFFCPRSRLEELQSQADELCEKIHKAAFAKQKTSDLRAQLVANRNEQLVLEGRLFGKRKAVRHG